MKFRKMSEYMDDPYRYIPEDSGEQLVQPDLSLSVRDILDRWVRDMPLDVLTRSGSYYLNEEDLPDDADFDTEDLDMLDPVDAQAYIEQRQAMSPQVTARHSIKPKSEGEQASERHEVEQASDRAE